MQLGVAGTSRGCSGVSGWGRWRPLTPRAVPPRLERGALRLGQDWAEFRDEEGDLTATRLVTHNVKAPPKLRYDENVLATTAKRTLERSPSVAGDRAADLAYRTEHGVTITPVTLEEMARLYSLAEGFGIARQQLVENGGRSVAQMIIKILGAARQPWPVPIADSSAADACTVAVPLLCRRPRPHILGATPPPSHRRCRS